MTDADWLAAVAASPDDPLVRLMYADWLDDHDDPRGELLRLDVELSSRPDEESADPLRQRLAELVPGVDVRWRAAICRVPVEAGEPFEHTRRHPLNVAGSWYTCGECMACDAPEAEAPALLAPLSDGMLTTHFVRQPLTLADVRMACNAAKVCCVQDLRYGGSDPLVIQMLGNNPAYCDQLLDWLPPPTATPAPADEPTPPLWRMLLLPESVPGPVTEQMRQKLGNVSFAIFLGLIGILVVLVMGGAFFARPVTP